MRDIGKLLLINLGIAALLVLLYLVNARRISWETAALTGAISFLYATITGGLAFYLMPRIGRRLRGSKAQVWAQLLAALVGIGILGGTIGFLLFTNNPFYPLRMRYLESVSANIILTVLIGSITMLAESSRRQLEATTLALRTQQLERERALKAASEAKLQSLESRIHPHFLFNTLNSISALVRTDPAAAEQLIERLAALLRFSLDRHGSLVSLADELQVTRDYLEIEKLRFESRLRYSIDVPAPLLAVSLPAMSLQTLAENSVKYAVAVSRSGAEIRISARLEGSRVFFSVTDTGPGFLLDTLPAGHGLDILRQRLAALYGPLAELQARQLHPGMEITFCLPC